MKTEKIFSISLAFIPLISFADMNSCVGLANTLKEYNISSQSSAFLNSAFDQYCDQSGSTKASGGGIGLDMVIKAIPIKFTGSYSSTEEGFRNFCKNYSSVATAAERKFSYEEKIATKSLETIDSCLRIAATGAVVTHEIPNAKSVVFYLQSGSATKLELKGLFPTPDDGVLCKSQVDGQLKNITEETYTKVEPSISISCSRTAKAQSSGVKTYEEQVITLATNLGNYTVFLPQDERMPIDMAQNISNRVDKLEASSFELSAKTLSLENDSNKEKVALKFVVVTNAENCPDGWTSQGVVGWIMHNPDYSNNVGKGGRFNDDWTWTHPRLCKR